MLFVHSHCREEREQARGEAEEGARVMWRYGKSTALRSDGGRAFEADSCRVGNNSGTQSVHMPMQVLKARRYWQERSHHKARRIYTYGSIGQKVVGRFAAPLW